MNNNKFPVTQTYLGNCMELAVYIEQVMFKYLKGVQPVQQIVAPGKRVIQNPEVGVKIIHAFAQRYVDDFGALWTGKAIPSFEEVMMPFIKDEWHYVYDEEAKENVLNYDVFEHLAALMIDLRTDLRMFLGEDHWVMHFVKTTGEDFYVQKTIDFRIYDWERKMAEGTWRTSVQEVAAPDVELSPNEQSLLDEKNHRAKEERERQENNARFGHI